MVRVSKKEGGQFASILFQTTRTNNHVRVNFYLLKKIFCGTSKWMNTRTPHRKKTFTSQCLRRIRLVQWWPGRQSDERILKNHADCGSLRCDDRWVDKHLQGGQWDQRVETDEHPSLKRPYYRKKSVGRDYVRSFSRYFKGPLKTSDVRTKRFTGRTVSMAHPVRGK